MSKPESLKEQTPELPMPRRRVVERVQEAASDRKRREAREQMAPMERLELTGRRCAKLELAGSSTGNWREGVASAEYKINEDESSRVTLHAWFQRDANDGEKLVQLTMNDGELGDHRTLRPADMNASESTATEQLHDNLDWFDERISIIEMYQTVGEQNFSETA